MVGRLNARSTRSGTLVGPGIWRKWRPLLNDITPPFVRVSVRSIHRIPAVWVRSPSKYSVSQLRNSIAMHQRQELAIWWARQQAAATQGASKLAHSKGGYLECGSLLPPSFGEACFASRDHRLHTQEGTGNRCYRIYETAKTPAESRTLRKADEVNLRTRVVRGDQQNCSPSFSGPAGSSARNT